MKIHARPEHYLLALRGQPLGSGRGR